MEDTTLLQEAAGDGLEPVRARDADQEMAALKSDVENIRTTLADEVMSRRQTALNTLLCLWEGQSDDGRKHKDDIGSDAMPFEGASDNRVRMCDRIVKRNVRQMTAAATRAIPKAIGIEGTDASGAQRIETLLHWLVKNQWGSDFRRQVKLLGMYQEADTPAGAVCWVDWEKETALEIREINPEELVALYAEFFAQGELDEGTLADLQDIALNPMRRDALIALLLEMVPTMTPKRAEKVADGLHLDGRAEFPTPYLRVNGPQIAALRLYQDVFFRGNVTDLQRAPMIHRRWLLTRAEVQERAATYGWDEEFVAQLIGDETEYGSGKEGLTAFTDEDVDLRVADVDSDNDPLAGLFEVIQTYRKAVNEDGVMGIYVTTWSYFCEKPARETEPFRRKHGKYPCVFFAREIMTGRLIDSRGVPEVFMTDQNSLKLLKDSFEDHVQVTTNPPVKVPPNRPNYTVALAPFGQLPANAREDVKFMERPPYPQAADRYEKMIRRDVDEYSGHPNEETDAIDAQLAQQERVDDFLACMADVMMMVVQLCQEFMPDSQLARIIGGTGMPIARSRAEIQGKFDIRLSYDVRDADSEFVLKKAKIAAENIKPLVMRGTIDFDQIALRVLQSLDANWADEAAVPAAVADAREAQEEKAAFVSILNGVEPQMREGINANLRLQVLQQEIDARNANPAAYPLISPISRAMLENRVKYLTFQAQQLENADIGRLGAEPVRPEDVAAQGQEPGAESGERTAGVGM